MLMLESECSVFSPLCGTEISDDVVGRRGGEAVVCVCDSLEERLTEF